MRAQAISRAAATLAAVLLLAAGIAVEWGDDLAGRGRDAEPVRPAAFRSELPADRYAALAAALRAGDLDAAAERIATLDASDRALLGDSRVLLGLAAFVHGDVNTAVGHLLAAGDDGPLGDWRWLALAEIAADEGDDETALERYGALVDRHPDSPLRPAALVAATRLYADRDEPFQALDLVELARRQGLEGQARVELETLAWRLGARLNDAAVRRVAARRLLVHAPWQAASLGVGQPYRDSRGRIDWSELLTPAELESRARTFLDLRQPDSARLTLEEVPFQERGTEWHLLAARALTRLHRSREALAVLELAPAQGDAQRARLEYRRALAAADLADPRGAGRHLGAEDREAYALASRRHLERTVALGEDPELEIAALRRLYRALEGEDYGRRRQVLAALSRHDPDDETGAAPLWHRGWTAYRNGAPAAAVEWWRELDELYPRSREAHRGRYWQARALEELGQRRHARRLYEELVEASDTSDFYRRQALVRLGSAPRMVGATAELLREPRPWDVSPELARAKRLSDLGLDPLAARELTLLEGRADATEATALEALILARSGQPNQAMVLLRRTFPELGGPHQGRLPTVLLRAYYPVSFTDEIRHGARRAHVPAYLLAGIIRQESGFDPRATSRVGARGLMQLMPPTAREVSADLGEPYAPGRLYDPEYSILLGSEYFRDVLEMFDGNLELALAGYNGGPSRIRRLWRQREPGTDVGAFVETLGLRESREYVKRILVHADSYRQLYPEAVELGEI